MSMRQDTIAVMKAQPERPASEVILLIAKRIGRSPSYARGMYDWAVAQGYHAMGIRDVRYRAAGIEIERLEQIPGNFWRT
jgi:hypothetical protein